MSFDPLWRLARASIRKERKMPERQEVLRSMKIDIVSELEAEASYRYFDLFQRAADEIKMMRSDLLRKEKLLSEATLLLSKIDHTISVHGKIDQNTPLHGAIDLALEVLDPAGNALMRKEGISK